MRQLRALVGGGVLSVLVSPRAASPMRRHLCLTLRRLPRPPPCRGNARRRPRGDGWRAQGDTRGGLRLHDDVQDQGVSYPMTLQLRKSSGSNSFTTSQEDVMRRHDTYVGLVRSTVVVCAIGFAWSSFALAEKPANPPAPSTTVQEEKATPAESDQVQERAIRKGEFGGVPTAPILDPVSFTCSAKTRKCSCRKSTPGDCAFMRAFVCGTVEVCPGSSQTCTCEIIQK